MKKYAILLREDEVSTTTSQRYYSILNTENITNSVWCEYWEISDEYSCKTIHNHHESVDSFLKSLPHISLLCYFDSLDELLKKYPTEEDIRNEFAEYFI